MKGPCEHCHNPDKSLWASECKYKGSYPSRRAFVLSTFDPPCAFDAYDEDMRRLANGRLRWFWLWAVIAGAAVYLLIKA